MDEKLKEYYGFTTGTKKESKPKPKKVPKIVKQVQQQLQIPFDYSKDKQISYSQFSTFQQCEHKWELNYKEGKYAFNSNINTVFGNALHLTIQHYITTIYEKSGAEADRINIEEYFETKYKEDYLKNYKSNNNIHFSNPEELGEFFDDGIAILNFLKKNRSNYFGKKGVYLVGCELPILIKPNEKYPNLFFKGFIDVVLYNERTNKFVLLDIKTSTGGWGDKQKRDETKLAQLLLYKKYFAEQFNVDIENIDIEFFIVKRKIWEEAEFAIAKRRIQQFIPASGKNKISKVTNSINYFLEKAYNPDGTYQNQTYNPHPSPNCQYCPYNKPGLCKRLI